MKISVVGGGVIGGGWIARLVLSGHDVHIYDPDPEAPRKTEAIVNNGARAWKKMTMAPPLPQGQTIYAQSLEAATDGAAYVIESVPERLDLKQSIHAAIGRCALKDAVIATSTSGLLPSDIQKEMTGPDRLVVTHPFNPVYLMPLVEIVAGAQTSPETVARAQKFTSSLGMAPIVIRKEIDAFVADRLLEALWRENLWLVKDDIATVSEIDEIMTLSLGLRFAQMGMFQSYRLAGGEGGMAQFLGQFGPTLSLPWTKLMDTPDLDEDLIAKIASDSDAQAEADPAGPDLRAMEQARDDCLVAIMQALKPHQRASGLALARHEKQLFDAAAAQQVETTEDLSAPLLMLRTTVPTEWIDYNNHMNESRYLQAFAESSDVLLRRIGLDSEYLASGYSYYTVETHINHIDEVAAQRPIHGTIQILAADEKRLHVFHHLYETGRDDTSDRLLATAEQMFLHVDMRAGRACAAQASILERLMPLVKAHEDLPWPSQAGRFVGQR